MQPVRESILSSSIRMLNKPFVKKGIKDLSGITSLAFGVLEIGNIYSKCQRSITPVNNSTNCLWPAAKKVGFIFAELSILLSAGVSRPGIWIISNIVRRFFSQESLEKAFGPYTIFAVNPWHPRHIVSICAAVFALPSALGAIKETIQTEKLRINFLLRAKSCDDKNMLLSIKTIRKMTLINTLTCRPFLHIGNQFARTLRNMCRL